MNKQLWISFTLPLLLVGCAHSRYPYCEEVLEETYVHPYGIEMAPNEWVERGQSGVVVSTLKTGVVVTKNFHAGELDGEVTHTFPHREQIEGTLTYDRGTLVKEEHNYPSGIVCEQIEYPAHCQRAVRRYYEQGTVKSYELFDRERLLQAKYHHPSGHVESGVEGGQGKRISRDAYGQLASVDEIVNGEMVSSTTYHANGTPQALATYQNGLVQGIRRTYLPGGEPATVEQWVNGKQQGITEVYQEGEKIAEVPYVNGVKQGVEKRLNDQGETVEEVSWADDQRHGLCRRYVNGQEVNEWYHRGRPVTRSVYEKLNGPERKRS